MGNKQSCCIYSTPRERRKKTEEKYIPTDKREDPVNQTTLSAQASSSNLQHISEREPDGEIYIMNMIQLAQYLNLHLKLCLYHCLLSII